MNSRAGARLVVGGEEVRNFFELVGSDEDSISLGIAWALRSSPRFLSEVLHQVFDESIAASDISIRVHRYERNGGITDIEVESPGFFHILIEAKRGWLLPDLVQLTKYARRVSFQSAPSQRRRIVTLSECSESFAAAHGPAKRIDGVSVRHISWRALVNACERARPRANWTERKVLQDLGQYLESVMTSQPKDSNRVYVLSLSADTPKGWQISLIDIVRQHSRYFHPVGGNGWPCEPPNYLAFRWSGRLQSIHHVDSYEVITDLKSACPGIPSNPTEHPHFLYHLGTPIVPSHEIRNGKLWPNARVWCAIDTLLTCQTISEARDLTQRRDAKS